MDFLLHIEAERGNCARTRNARLRCNQILHAFPLQHCVPSALEQSLRILAIPTKKNRYIIDLLSLCSGNAGHPERNPPCKLVWVVVTAPMLHLCFAAGLRVSELVGLPLSAVTLQPTPMVLVMGQRAKRAIFAPMETDCK